MSRISRFRLLTLSTSAALLVACAGTNQMTAGAGNAPPPAEAAAAAEVAQSQQRALFTTMRLPAEAYDEFAPVMQTNVRASRQEPGNVSFEVFRPEDDSPTLLIFERWRDAAAIQAHDETPNLAAVLAAVKSTGTAISEVHELVEVQPSGAATRRAPIDSATSRNVLVQLKVKPEAEETFLQAWRDVFAHARAAPGNAVFEIYKDLKHPQTYVLIERWDSAAQHEAHLAQPYSAALDAVLPGTLAAPIVNSQNRFLAHGVLD